MPPTPETASSNAGVWRLNGVIWGLLLLLALAVAGLWGDGNYRGLGALLLLPLVAGAGMVANSGLFFWSAVRYRFRQALLYSLSFVLLAVALFWLRDFVGNNIPGKIGG